MFDSDEDLEKITILNSTSVIKIGNDNTGVLMSKADGADVFIAVPKAMYNAYKTNFPEYFGNIPSGHFSYFENYTIDGNLTYYWNVLDENQKIAYIDYVEGTLPTTLEFPSTLDGYTIVMVSKNVMSAISGVTKVVLPDDMAYLAFTTADMADTIAELQIADGNAKFKTVEGVLYSADGKTLLIYPRNRAGSIYYVESGASEIAYRAFYGTKNLVTLIINDVVTVRDNAFEKTGISVIKFTNSTASVFAGRDIFLDANASLKVRVPGAALTNYRNNVLIDYSIIDNEIIIAA